MLQITPQDDNHLQIAILGVGIIELISKTMQYHCENGLY